MKIRSVIQLPFILSFVWLSSGMALGQSTSDSIRTGSKVNELRQVISFSDSLQSTTKKNLGLSDSIPGRQPMSVDRSNHHLDSIQNTFKNLSDSLMFSYTQNRSKLDSLRSSLRKEFDSLTNINLPGNRVAEKLDSVRDLQAKVTDRFETKLQEMQDQASSEIAKLNLPPEVAEKVKGITGNINHVNNPNFKLKNTQLGRLRYFVGTN